MELIPIDDIEDPFLLLAKKFSERSKLRFKLGAIITKRNKVIGVGYNSHKTHSKYGSGKYCTLHSEGSALYNAIKRKNDVSGATIYVYRRHMGLAKPCEDCRKLLQRHGIKKVFYSNRPSIYKWREM